MKQLRATIVTVGTLALAPVFFGACSEAAALQDELCCPDYKPGTDLVKADIGGSIQGRLFAQGVADLSATATAIVDDLTAGCRNIAIDLEATQADRDAASAVSGRDAMKAWCSLALRMIGTVKGSAQLTVQVDAPKCDVSVSAKAKCQAQCSVDGKCDIKATPPKCTGGKLEVSCKGSCTAEASASVACQGECTGNCEGSCTAEGGVQCVGSCEGTCEGGCQAEGGIQCQGQCTGTCEGQCSGTNNNGQCQGTCNGTCKGTCSVTPPGVKCTGSCQGTCKGTCSVTPPGVKCTGSCNGQCSASCKGSASASVKCDGKCDGEFEPLRCSGGKLEGGCQVDAKCDGSCNASVSAKAECSPPEVVVNFSGGTNLGKLRATLEANLPKMFAAIKGRLEAVGSIGGELQGNLGAALDIKKGCIIPVTESLANAVQDLGASVEVSGQITGGVGAK